MLLYDEYILDLGIYYFYVDVFVKVDILGK